MSEAMGQLTARPGRSINTAGGGEYIRFLSRAPPTMCVTVTGPVKTISRCEESLMKNRSSARNLS